MFMNPDEFFYEADMVPEAVGGAVGIFFVVYLLMMFIASAISMASYVLQSLGMYTIADRRGIRHSWLAWVPLGNLWILGSISDQYQYLAKGNIKNRRKVLLGLSIGFFLFYIVWIVAMIVGLILTEGLAGEAVAGILLIVLGALLMVAMAIAMVVYQYLCLYDLYSSCNPSNAVLYLVLSIVFSVTMPIFVFVCRKKDLGMPPRKQPAPQPVVEVVEEAPAVEIVTAEGFAQPEEFEE